MKRGDYVEKDSVLFTLDNSDALINIQKAQNSLAKADIANKSNQETMEDWVSTAPVTGYISDLNLKVGDTVNANTAVCTITNDDVITVKIPFSAAHIDSIYVGATAQLTSADYMTSNIYGTVSDIDRTPIRSSDGGVMYNVEITLDNPGAIAGGMSFTATINGILSAAAGTSEAADSEQLFTKASGKVVAVYHTNGDKVNAGDTIIEISNSATLDSIDQSNIEYDDLQLSLQSQYDELEDYTIKSPISGTVIKKEYKAGDTIGNSTQSVVLATIADMSKMKFTMDVDELDISKIQVGQSVERCGGRTGRISLCRYDYADHSGGRVGKRRYHLSSRSRNRHAGRPDDRDERHRNRCGRKQIRCFKGSDRGSDQVGRQVLCAGAQGGRSSAGGRRTL